MAKPITVAVYKSRLVMDQHVAKISLEKILKNSGLKSLSVESGGYSDFYISCSSRYTAKRAVNAINKKEFYCAKIV